MEALLVAIPLIGLALAAMRYGVDTRPRIDDEPRRAI